MKLKMLFILMFMSIGCVYGDVHWEQIFSPDGITCLLAGGLIIGAPIIITLVILIPVWLLQFLGKWIGGFTKDLSSEEDE